LWCWGANWWAELGDGTTTTRTSPLQVTGTTWAGVSVDYGATCATRTDASLWCWGQNTTGAFGSGALAIANGTPTEVQDGYASTRGAVGAMLRCGRSTAGEARCFGWSREGQTGREAAVATPRLVVLAPARWRS
jgi:alpha-tubulin suppressor-like RCC1 family protein